MTRRPASRITAECTDLRNAERFVELHGHDVRYVPKWAKWLEYDGRRWALDETGASLRLAADTARVMAGEARGALAASMADLEGLPADGDPRAKRRGEQRKRLNDRAWAWALKSQAAARLHAIVDLAKADASIAVTHDRLDADPWAFNVANGTLDLRTGKLRPHRREDLVTKVSPVPFDARAACPTWDAFLSRAMGGNTEMVAFLRRMAGYALTGVIREHVLGFMFGGGANGKSTYIATTRAMMGDYAVTAPRGLLFRSRGERHPTELTVLFGARFVACAEIEEGRAFDEGLVKDLTGGDEISARRMAEDFWSFAPTHKLFIAGNHRPSVRGDDEGIWRRIRLIPWTVTIPPEERDPLLVDKLRDELPGILAWAVRGCLEWQASGLGEPVEVTKATADYRDESDLVGEFFRLRCVFGGKGDVETRKLLRAVYTEWCEENGFRPVDAKTFARKLRDRGVADATKRDGLKFLDAWRGVRLLSEAERTSGYRFVGGGDVGTCGEHVPVSSQNDFSHDPPNRDPDPTRPHIPTDDERGLFDDLIHDEGVA